MLIDERKPTGSVREPLAAPEVACVLPSAETAVPEKHLLELMVRGEPAVEWERVMARVNEEVTRHQLAAPGPVNLIFDSIPTMVASVADDWDAVGTFAATVKHNLDATVEELKAAEWWQQLELPADRASALEHIKQLVENRIHINLDGGDEKSHPAHLESTEKGGFTKLMDYNMGEYRRIFSENGLALPRKAYLFGWAHKGVPVITDLEYAKDMELTQLKETMTNETRDQIYSEWSKAESITYTGDYLAWLQEKKTRDLERHNDTAQYQAELASIKEGAAKAVNAGAAKIAQLQAELASITDRAAAAQAAAAAEIAQLQARAAREEVAMVGLKAYVGKAILPFKGTRERMFRHAKEIGNGTREHYSGETGSAGSGCVSGWTPRLGQGAASRVADECMEEHKREQPSVGLSSSLVTAPGAVEP